MGRRRKGQEEKGTGDSLSILDLANEHMLARVPEKPKKPRSFGTGNFKKKVVSDSAAVHPDQIPEVREHCRKHGIATPEFASHGRPIFDNSAHFRRYLKSLGRRHYGYV